MPITPEKNDVDISRLFGWAEEITIGPVTCYMRLVGDADLNRARVAALRRSAELRKKLKTMDSDERLAYIPDPSDIERDSLIETMVLQNVRQVTLESIDKVDIPFPKEISSDATLEQQENHQREIDEYPQRREQAVKNYILRRLEEIRGLLETKPIEVLLRDYERGRINELCEVEMQNVFLEMCVYSGTFKDRGFKERLFESFEEFTNLPPDAKRQFMEVYSKLEIPMDELKK